MNHHQSPKQIQLKNLIGRLSFQINQLKGKIDICDNSNRMYNRLLIQRACARKKLMDLRSKNIFSFIFKKFKFSNEKKLISDYFNGK